jgi:uncharacterized protein
MDAGAARRKPAYRGGIVRVYACVLEPCMPVDPELLEILACPNCKTKVDLVKNGTALKCGQCHRVYPIKDDIPVMLLDEATIEP